MSDLHNHTLNSTHNPTPPATFTRSVLDRLQLDPCAAAQEQLLEDAWIEAATPPSQPLSLLAQHLQHCESCRALLSALQMSQSGLPVLRHRQAPAGLLERTLQKTAGLQAPQRLRKLSRLQHWLLRPRFALESAYLGSLLFVLVVGLPVSNAVDVQQLELQFDVQIDQQLTRLQQLIHQGKLARNENLSLLERTYQNSREDWIQLTQNTREWLQLYNTPWIDSIKTTAETVLPSSSNDTTGATP